MIKWWGWQVWFAQIEVLDSFQIMQQVSPPFKEKWNTRREDFHNLFNYIFSAVHIWVWVRFDAIIVEGIPGENLPLIMLKKSTGLDFLLKLHLKCLRVLWFVIVAEAKCLVRRRRLPLWERWMDYALPILNTNCNLMIVLKVTLINILLPFYTNFLDDT